MKLNEWLESGEYQVDIDKLRTNIMKHSAISSNESTTAAIFEREIYCLVRAKTDRDFDIIKEKEIDGIKHTFEGLKNRTSGKGRLDAVVNDLIIEYKHYSKLETQKDQKIAIEQVKDYLMALKNQDNIECDAILTDGIRISYFTFLEDKIQNTNISTIENEDIDTIIRAILANDTKKFVPKNILEDFSIDLIAPSISKSVAQTLYNSLKNNKTDKTKMLSDEWKELMHLSIEDNGKGNDIKKRRKDLSLIFSDSIDNTQKEYDAIYSLQTTYAIIVKLIACKVLDKLNYNDSTKNYFDLSNVTSNEMQSFFENMEDGYSYKNSNITNFLEGDFYSWYSDKLQWNNNFYTHIKDIIKSIDQYSAFSLDIYYEPIDIFKDLYMSIMPKSIRHSMGEYFTPKWLADYVVTNALEDIKKKDWKAIDPCCGSGIFLLELIKKIVGNKDLKGLTKKEKLEIQNEILSRVYGIDINPLSVLSARVGYYLALKPFGFLKDIEIPVYLGDSAILSQKVVIDGIDCYMYEINNLKEPFEVVFPIRFVKLENFGHIMSELQACVKTEDENILYDYILNNFTEFEKKSNMLKEKIREMSRKLVYLHIYNWDGIWIRIAMNFMFIARIDNIDLIIGNPPWVKWEHLPEVYASKIKKLCDIKHIFSGAGQYGGTQLNICALISNVTATNWLSENGILAFLMPDSIMSQDSYEGFRNFYLDYDKNERLYLQKIDRWKAPLRPFRADNKVITQDFNTYYYSRKMIDYYKGIPVINITRERNIKDEFINSLNSYKEAKKYLHFSSYEARQLSMQNTSFSYTFSKYDFSEIIGPTDYTYRTGVEFTPQELFMLKGLGSSEKDNYYRFSNKEFSLSKYKINDMPKDGWNFPTNIIYPIITGPHLKEFVYDTNNEFCILPYSKENPKVPISNEEMLKCNKDILLYLANHKNIIDMQSEKSKQMRRGNEFYALSKIGSYTFADNIVAARDNSKFCASVISKEKTPWGEYKQTICVKHTIIISQDKTGRFISNDEAFYICGILNSDVIQQYIQTTQKSNGFSLNKSNIYLPLYSDTNEVQNKIVNLAKKATNDNKANIEKIKEDITNLYLKLCREKRREI